MKMESLNNLKNPFIKGERESILSIKNSYKKDNIIINNKEKSIINSDNSINKKPKFSSDDNEVINKEEHIKKRKVNANS